jgi:hypothetical protein
MSLFDGLQPSAVGDRDGEHSLNTVANHCRNIGIISDAQCRFGAGRSRFATGYLQKTLRRAAARAGNEWNARVV